MTPGKARFNGERDVPEHLKSKVKAMFNIDSAYRELPDYDKTYCCDAYDTCPKHPDGLPTLQEIHKWHDIVPYKTGYAICHKTSTAKDTTERGIGPMSEC